MLEDYLPQKLRATVYRFIAALAPLAATYGYISDKEASLWVALVASLLGTGLAALNTKHENPDKTNGDS